MEGHCSHAGPLQPLGEFASVKDVGKLGLRIRCPSVVRSLVKVDVVEINVTFLAHGNVVVAARDVDDSRRSRRLEQIKKEIGQQEMTQVIRGKLQFMSR